MQKGRLSLLLLLPMLGACGGKQAIDDQSQDLQRPVAESRAAYKLPALVGAKITRTRIQTATQGVRRVGVTGDALSTDRWHIGSCAKSFTATLAAILVESGRLRWNLTVAEALPDLATKIRTEYRTVTLEMLLGLRGGVKPVADLEALQSVPSFSGTLVSQRSQFAEWALVQAPESAPGTFSYSNGDYIVAAAMIERVLGTAWEDLIRTRLYQPLGMTTVKAGWPAQGAAQQPWGHLDLGEGDFVPHDPNDATQQIPDYMAPAGGLSMVATDYAKFLQMNLRGLSGETTLVRPATMQKLHTAGPEGFFGLGWGKRVSGGETVSFFIGSAGTFLADAELRPSQQLATLAITNVGDGDRSVAACEELLAKLRTR